MRRFKVAQAPPPGGALPPVAGPPPGAGAPPPAPGGDPGGGMPPPPGGGMPPPPPGPDPAAMAPAGARPQEIAGPLDSVSKIAYDAGAEDKVDNSPVTSDGGEADNFVDNEVSQVADEIWTQYGGVIDTKHMQYVADPDKRGQRTDKDAQADPEQQAKAREATDSQRYLRLPAGKTITDVTTYEDLSQVVRGLLEGKLKPPAPPAAPPGGDPSGGGAPPGGMMMASQVVRLLRTATVLDGNGEYHKADQVERLALRQMLELL